ncbi:hypothetical protein Y032_0004g2184 [Ancylostoma ceylanicum]|uniref:NADH dehydrogenase [ubiquinone] 1 alpha subcomplex subunit 12 n=1 Tax=Ancylostoma ceylanicum TaxID=53326 RepID=A0A016VXK8_9BILA|nr:hypothetical protein Y032_0004g2184 [Ancylostoma ceylanicum]
MSRPGAWARVMTNLWKYLRKDWSTKHYIGEDSAGHRYYEIQNTRQNVTRGYDPPPNNPTSQPGVEWQSWLKGTRRFPPSDDEIALNRMKEQDKMVGVDQSRHLRYATHLASSEHRRGTECRYSDLRDASDELSAVSSERNDREASASRSHDGL